MRASEHRGTQTLAPTYELGNNPSIYPSIHGLIYHPSTPLPIPLSVPPFIYPSIHPSTPSSYRFISVYPRSYYYGHWSRFCLSTLVDQHTCLRNVGNHSAQGRPTETGPISGVSPWISEALGEATLAPTPSPINSTGECDSVYYYSCIQRKVFLPCNFYI